MLALAQAEESIKVHVGIYVNRIYNFNLRDGQFATDFYIWFGWKGKGINPIETFEISNGKIETREGVHTKKIKDYTYASARINATIYQHFDTIKFPFDSHSLKIKLEDTENEIHKIQYIADMENSKNSPHIDIIGYKIHETYPKILKRSYATNFGDIKLPSGHKSYYSQYHDVINIQRPSLAYFFKLYWGIFVSVLVALLSFFIKPTDLEPRFGLGVGALFAVMANIFIISGSLTDNGLMSTGDVLNILAVSVICIALVISTISLNLATNGRELISKRLDSIGFVLIFVTYVSSSIYFVLIL